MLIALGVLVFNALVVFADRGGYSDIDGDVSLLDAFYYTSVTLSTTGYGDIAPITPEARLVNILVITPLRVAFLVVLIGTTVETLTKSSRDQIRYNRWRKKLRDHIVVIGYGVKGRSAVSTLRSNDIAAEQIVVVDPDPTAVAEANDSGLVGIVGDATRSDVLRRAGVPEANRVIITTARDDSSVLATLTARQLNTDVKIISSIREAENVPLAKQGGADEVVTSSEAVGRILGLTSVSPPLGRVLEDLITSGQGLEVTERAITPREEGKTPRELQELVVAVIRPDGDEQSVLPYYSAAIGHLVRDDRVVVVRPAQQVPWASHSAIRAVDIEEPDDPADRPPGI
jgi:voltage-gated potassium channel